MILDDQDVHLKVDDMVVQCCTNHAWSTRSGEVLFVLIDGAFEERFGGTLETRNSSR